jgi:hypothetical protein
MPRGFRQGLKGTDFNAAIPDSGLVQVILSSQGRVLYHPQWQFAGHQTLVDQRRGDQRDEVILWIGECRVRKDQVIQVVLCWIFLLIE